MTAEWKDALAACAGKEAVHENAPMALYTSFRVGGPARYLVKPADEEALVRTVAFVRAEGIPYTVIGNGTNLLVSDRGFDGVVIRIGRDLSGLEVRGERIRAGAGALLSAVASCAQREGLGGFAFAAGIPGSFGGACIMNAGAYGGEMKDVLENVRVLTRDGSVTDVGTDGFRLYYRGSSFKENGDVVLGGTIRLTPDDPGKILSEMEELRIRRQEKQPLDLPSAGSTFKRPEGYFAGKLITDAGLKGLSRGGAQVSEKHAGFIVNTGGATAADVYGLIGEVRERVLASSGVLLTPEVQFLGEFE